MRSRGTLVAIIIVITVILDQILKVWVKTSFYLGEDMPILSWFHLLFIENNGMAFGMTIGSKLAPVSYTHLDGKKSQARR